MFSSGMFSTTPTLTLPFLKLELNQTVSATPKMGAELGRAL